MRYKTKAKWTIRVTSPVDGSKKRFYGVIVWGQAIYDRNLVETRSYSTRHYAVLYTHRLGRRLNLNMSYVEPKEV